MSSFPKELCIPIRSPLNKMDTEKQTFGCRQANPDICGYCYIEGVCALLPKTQFVNIHLLSGKNIFRT